MFFFFATQAYRQNVDNGIYRAVVPTQDMRNGNFTDAAYLKALNGTAINNVPNNAGLRKWNSSHEPHQPERACVDEHVSIAKR